MISPKWRNFKLKNGGIVSIGYLPLGKGEFSWAAQYERPHTRTYDEDIRAGGSSLRKVMGELRLKIAADENPNVEKVTKKMTSGKVFLGRGEGKEIRNDGDHSVYLSMGKTEIKLSPGGCIRGLYGDVSILPSIHGHNVTVLEFDASSPAVKAFKLHKKGQE